jgi:preprotein translocase subunit SecF
MKKKKTICFIFTILLIIIASVCFLYPSKLHIENVKRCNIEITYENEKVQINEKQKEDLIKILNQVELYRVLQFSSFTSTINNRTELTIEGDFNKNYNFIHISVYSRNLNDSFAQLTNGKIYRIDKEDLIHINNFLTELIFIK